MKIISRLPCSAIVLALSVVKATSALSDEDAIKSASKFLLDRLALLHGTEGNKVEEVDTKKKSFLPKKALQNSPRIINGDDAPANLYPWYANLSSDYSRCGGTLVAPWYVLTAAHCVTDIPDYYPYTITVGLLCDDRENCGQAKEVRYVQEVIIRPGYDDYLMENDIALIKLTEAISTITPAVLDLDGLSDTYNNG